MSADDRRCPKFPSKAALVFPTAARRQLFIVSSSDKDFLIDDRFCFASLLIIAFASLAGNSITLLSVRLSSEILGRPPDEMPTNQECRA